MIIGYLLVTAVLVVTLGRLGDMFGRVKIYNLGFVVFTLASIALSLDPLHGGGGALWLIGWRLVQAFGGAMLMANSAAILTDAFPANQRGMALGINQIAGISGQFIGLLLGGLLAAWDWRAVFWVNVPIGVFGTIWAYRSLREIATTRRAKIDWAGNVTFALGAGALLAAITYGIQPYGGHATGWTNPRVLDRPDRRRGAAGRLRDHRDQDRRADVPDGPVQDPGLRGRERGQPDGLDRPRRAAVHAGHLAGRDLAAAARLRLPVTPLWAGIYMLPLTAGFLIAGPDLRGACRTGTARGRSPPPGCWSRRPRSPGCMLLPVNFPYWLFATDHLLQRGRARACSPRRTPSAIMSSVPAEQRGAASGMRSTFQNSGMSLSIGIFFSLMIAGLAAALPSTLSRGPAGPGRARRGGRARLAPAAGEHAVLGLARLQPDPQPARSPPGCCTSCPARNVAALTSKQYFPHLISGPFHHGLIVVFSAAIAMSLAGALISLLRGSQFYYADPAAAVTPVPAGGAAAARDCRGKWGPSEWDAGKRERL